MNELVDFTDDEIQALKLACRLVRISDQAGALPRAQAALAAHLTQVLTQLAAYKRAVGCTPSLAVWPIKCKRFIAFDLPATCTSRAAQEHVPDQLTLREIERQMQRARELALQTSRALVVSAAHATAAGGCSSGPSCMFCLK